MENEKEKLNHKNKFLKIMYLPHIIIKLLQTNKRDKRLK